MSILTKQEIDKLAEKHLHTLADKPYFAWFDYARAIEAKVIEKIKTQGPVATVDEYGIDLLTEIPLGTQLYKLPEGD